MKQKGKMKKINFLWLFLLAFIAGSCESEMDKELAALKEAANNSQVSINMLNTSQTRAGGIVAQAFFAPGEKVGVMVVCNNQLTGPLPYTINSTMTGLVEPLPIISNSSEHLLYAYFPYDANQSDNLNQIDVTPVKAVQTQNGNDDKSAIEDAFYVGVPTSYYVGDNPTIQFASTYTNFQFQINTNISGLVVESIELKAPNGKVINFTSAQVDITKQSSDPAFGELTNIKGGTSTTTLKIDNGGLNAPNSTTDYAIAYMNICPFNSANQKLTVTVKTAANGTYTYDIDGDNYIKGTTYNIPIRIEKKKQIKNIRVLSLCEVGCLGTKDNTKQWNCYYGALNVHAKEIRRVLFEYFGKGKLVETGVISFDKTDTKCCLNKMKDSDLDKYDIIYLNNNARPDAALSRRIMNWLNRSENRVLMLAYDWKDPCVTPNTKESLVICKTTTNYLMFKNEIQDVVPHWYNSCYTNYNIGNYGAPRSGIMVPVELNDRTKYFWKDGPFKTDLTESSDQRYWIQDKWWGSAKVTSPNVIPLISYRDAKDDCYQTRTHKYGAGDGGMVLGVDPTTRIVYIGDSEIFSTECVSKKTQNARMAKRDGCKGATGLNNYSKIMGNLWAWMIDEVIQK